MSKKSLRKITHIGGRKNGHRNQSKKNTEKIHLFLGDYAPKNNSHIKWMTEKSPKKWSPEFATKLYYARRIKRGVFFWPQLNDVPASCLLAPTFFLVIAWVWKNLTKLKIHVLVNRACVGMCMFLEQPLTVVLEPCLYACSYDSRVTRESCRNHACVCVCLCRTRTIFVRFSSYLCVLLENRAEIVLVCVCVCVVLVRFSHSSRTMRESC